LEEIKGVPDKFLNMFPYNDRPRGSKFGVTEILYCPRKTFLARFVRSPDIIDFEVRKRFARGHALESVFFGDAHNPLYFVGDGELSELEGHSDHAVLGDDGKVEDIVEFKTVRKLWYGVPDGRFFYSLKAARNAIDRSEWKKIARSYNLSHFDQLKLYMILSGAKNGYLIYYEMSTDDNYTWYITSDEITDEFKNRMISRLNYVKNCCDNNIVPVKNTIYDWECGFCSYNKNGICSLCDVKEFNFDKFASDLKSSGNIDIDFNTIISKNLQRYNVEAGVQKAFSSEESRAEDIIDMVGE